MTASELRTDRICRPGLAKQVRRFTGVALAAFALALHAGSDAAANDAGVLDLRLTTAAAPADTLTISLLRWPTDAERTPLLAALAPPPPRQGGAGAGAASPGGPAAGPAAAGGARGARAGGAGGRGRGAAPVNPMTQLATAVKAAPTLGYIWGSGITGYSIKYAWRSPATGQPSRIVLITDRRINLPQASTLPATGTDAEAEFTLIEMRLDARGTGEGKTSLTTKVVVDQAAGTIALDDYAAGPATFRIGR